MFPEGIDTPEIMIDRDVLERNIKRMAARSIVPSAGAAAAREDP